MSAFVVSGVSTGIGRAVTERLIADGHAVWGLGANAGRLDALRAEVAIAGTTQCDVADETEVDRAVQQVGEALGHVDGVFVNAGIDGLGSAAGSLSVEHFRRVLDVNVIGAFLVAQRFLPLLSRPGTIVFNASVNALRPEAHFLDYNASKAAVVSMARTMALELSADQISVMALCPGYFPTPMTQSSLDDPTISAELLSLIPARRFGELPEIAELVAFLLGPSARFMTGAIVPIDGGRGI
jgi:NAD(P)-dependent dehydrogenase (short-subunit alcohol dehydrogenase family)